MVRTGWGRPHRTDSRPYKDHIALLNRKKRASMTGDREEVRSVHKELGTELGRIKNRYRERLENKLLPTHAPPVGNGHWATATHWSKTSAKLSLTLRLENQTIMP